MNLSPERQAVIKTELENRLGELTRQADREIQEIKTERYQPPEKIRKINNRHIEKMQEMANFAVKTYLDAYETDNEILSSNDTVEIVLQLTAFLNDATLKRDNKVGSMHNLFNDTEQYIKDILEGARSGLETARIKIEHESKSVSDHVKT